jgi:acyl-CoA synthetase (AMP-forming)/AMP-acid ligase II
VCAKHPEWDALPIDRRAERNGRQGVRYHMQEAITVLDPVTMEPVPADGETMGEIMFRGNLVMKGYLKNEKATNEAFAGGWFHTGDLAVMHPDGYVKIKDRSKDVIISGGENISSLEVEEVLYRHPAVMTAAVVARPTRSGVKCPRLHRGQGRRRRHRRRHHRPLPRTPGALQGAQAHRVLRAAQDLDRQDPEVRAARDGQVRLGHRVRSSPPSSSRSGITSADSAAAGA